MPFYVIFVAPVAVAVAVAVATVALVAPRATMQQCNKCNTIR